MEDLEMCLFVMYMIEYDASFLQPFEVSSFLYKVDFYLLSNQHNQKRVSGL